MYQPVSVRISRNQALKLVRGHSIQLKPSDLFSGDVVLHLTAQQAKRLARAKDKNKGARLQLLPDQVSHCLMHGSGFKDLLDKARQKVNTTNINQKSLQEYVKKQTNYWILVLKN